MKIFKCCSLDDTKVAAEFFAQFACPGQCYALYGNLGFGKTTFTQYLIQSLNPCIKGISSPTFTLVQTYSTKICDVFHVDCYRMKSEEEFYELGLDEAFPSGITIIEWPEIIERYLPSSVMKIIFSKKNNILELSCSDV
ncbi:MAG: tRNA (adenosine(37)-N6)-threonylcarbamoyltransferase complex ATPase subunit type 1 TsaE [Alphaproteobacteria bacterium]|nr:tRNA (adenosine(37)-N6)-threonylcarbamoyltransferase complex ATPase subunit type 1 TsaE [Alphaproteobacteria bacterium]